jgi:opacity protein-like surface antigen
MLTRNIFRAAAIFVALAACSGKVAAADLGSFFSDTPQTSVAPVQFGTGWYLRGDAGAAYDSVPNISPDLSQFLSNSGQVTANLDLGFGYKFNSWLRGDVIVDWWKPNDGAGSAASQTCITQLTTINNFPVVTATDQCTPQYNSSIQRWDLLGNLYADIGTWYGITPYIGGGAGLSLTHVSSTVNWFMSNGLPYQVTTDGFYYNWDRSYSYTRYQFAWAAMAGFSYAFSSNILLDVGYRYINLGKLYGINDASGNSTSKVMNAQEFRLGIRYLID